MMTPYSLNMKVKAKNISLNFFSEDLKDLRVKG